jgi:hypothetical protein
VYIPLVALTSGRVYLYRYDDKVGLSGTVSLRWRRDYEDITTEYDLKKISVSSPSGNPAGGEINSKFTNEVVFMKLRTDKTGQLSISASGIVSGGDSNNELGDGKYEIWIDPEVTIEHKEISVLYEDGEHDVVWADEAFRLESNESEIGPIYPPSSAKPMPWIPSLLLDD